MANSPNVAIRFGELDKAALKELATRLERSQSDTLRILVRETLAVLKERDEEHRTGMAEHATPTTRT